MALLAKSSQKKTALIICIGCVLLAHQADARRQLVPDLPSVEVHLEVLQSLAVTSPNYSGFGQQSQTASPFAQRAMPVQAQPVPQQRVVQQPQTARPLPAPPARVAQPVIQPVQPFTPPQVTRQIQQPAPAVRTMPKQQPTTVAKATPYTQPVTAPKAVPKMAAAPKVMPAPKAIVKAQPALPTTPIRSVAEGYQSPFAVYEPAATAQTAPAPKPTLKKKAPTKIASTPKASAPKAAIKQAPTIPKIEPKQVAAAPKPAPLPAPPAPKVIAQVPQPQPLPNLPEPNLSNMVFEDFPNISEPMAKAPAPIVAPKTVAKVNMPAIPALPAPRTQTPSPISPAPVQPEAESFGLPALPDLGSFEAEPELQLKDPVMPSGRSVAARNAPDLPKLPDLPPMAALAQAPTPQTVSPVAPAQPAFTPSSNLPSLNAIIGEPDPSDGIVAQALPELPSELPALPVQRAVAPAAEPLPEFVMPDAIPQEVQSIGLPEFDAPQEMELAALPAPPPSDPVFETPKQTSASIGPTALTISYTTDDTRLPEAKKAELEALAEQIISSGKNVRILGYAGGPPEQSSLTRRVSLARVLDVRAHLINFGVPANKVTPQSLGNKGAGTRNPDRVEIVLQ